MLWHALNAEEVLSSLRTSTNGLTHEEVARRLKIYGRNTLEAKGISPLKIFLRQFTNFLIVVLIASASIAGLLGEVIDAEAIGLAVILMGISGFVQEFRAEKAMEALKKMAAPKAKVLRNGRITEVKAEDLVPGDIIVLSAGDKVPADARLVYSEGLQVDESPLTGESTPVLKDHEVILPDETPLSERINMVFMGTFVVMGKSYAVVVATGNRTELGKIAKSLTQIKEKKSLLEEELDKLGKKLGIIVLGISALIFVTSVFMEGMTLINALLISIALAVAAIPESLPAVATTILALGAYRMAKRNAIVRELGAIETLGACDVIASDKTGTITKGEMTVKTVWVGGEFIKITGIGYEPKGEIIYESSSSEASLRRLAKYLVMHVKPDVELVKEDNKWTVKGSPTEGAVLVLSAKVLGLKNVHTTEPRVVKIFPFDRHRKRKTTIHDIGDKYLIISSGAPELLLDISAKVIDRNNMIKPTNKELRNKLRQTIDNMASQGYRVLGVAFKEVTKEKLKDINNPSSAENNLCFAALLGMIDPPREGVKEAIEELRNAGIKVIMITGDHKLTAAYIAREIGLLEKDSMILDGQELDNLDDKELKDLIDKVDVFARVRPDHKRRIVEALKSKGHIVAMTGDGVNDAPALKEADIGIAMGIRGTDVAKEASKIILKDDNFVTIVKAVEEGRVIYENLKKPINYLLPANLGEVTTLLFAELSEFPTPLTAPQLLWVNITTDSLPALALSAEPPEPGLMRKSPRKKASSFITNKKLLYFSFLGGLIGLTNLLIFHWGLKAYGIPEARTLVFTALAFSEFGRAFTSRSEKLPMWWRPFNKWLLPALIASATLQLIVLYLPALNVMFQAMPLPPSVLFVGLLTALPVLVVDEVRKALKIEI